VPGAREQLVFIDPTQHEEKLGFFIESRADAIEYRRDVLAHVRPIRTGAGQLDFAGRWKQAIAFSAYAVHDAFRQLPLQQFDQGIDRSGTVSTDRFPAARGNRRDGDLDLVEIETLTSAATSPLAICRSRTDPLRT
jgi:hypothetical protein